MKHSRAGQVPPESSRANPRRFEMLLARNRKTISKQLRTESLAHLANRPDRLGMLSEAPRHVMPAGYPDPRKDAFALQPRASKRGKRRRALFSVSSPPARDLTWITAMPTTDPRRHPATGIGSRAESRVRHVRRGSKNGSERSETLCVTMSKPDPLLGPAWRSFPRVQERGSALGFWIRARPRPILRSTPLRLNDPVSEWLHGEISRVRRIRVQALTPAAFSDSSER